MATSPETSPISENPPPITDSTTSEESPPLPPPSTTPPPESSPPPPPDAPPPSTPTPTPPPPSSSSPPPIASTPPPTPESPPAPPPPPPETQTPPPTITSPPPSTPPPPSATPSPPAPNNSPPAPTASSPPPPGASVPPQTPPSAVLSPPPPPRSDSSFNKSSGSSVGQGGSTPRSSSSGSDVTLIVVVVVGGLLVLLVIIVCLLCTRRSKKKPASYIETGLPPTDGVPHYNASTQWNAPQTTEQMINLPPPPGLMVPPRGGWNAPPTPPGANHSSDYSTSGYSGQHHMPMSPKTMGGIGGKSQFTYEELAAATNGFSQSNLLGQGGFGYVHKGVLPDQRQVAVKSLKAGSGQGEREFQAEVETISRVHHRHLVSLVGYCIADQQRMLVYEFVPNKTLEFHLHGKGQPVMDWATRLRIAVGSAKGLAYLHEDCHPRVIHRDIKAANILLEDNFEAMVADFGLAKFTSDNNTHVSTRVMGTFGYLAPEYASSGKLSEKSDVFSFGVMLLELITGRRPLDLTNKTMEDSLVDWARPLLSKALEDGNYNEFVDPRLEGNYVPHEMARMVTCAAASIRHSARRRPKMSQIVRALDGDSSLEHLKEGVKPEQSTVYHKPNGNTEAYDTRAYDADMLRFKKMVMSTQEFDSSEYGGSDDSREMGMRKA